MDFKNITFKGKFRDYQQRVIDNFDKHIKDGKINIVAAPGSGKTVLGLELIRRLNSPCIVLSPTTAIRQQWGERFKGMFLSDENDFSKYFSNDLHDIKLLNSITYQALYTAVMKISESSEGEVDCSDINVLSEMKKYGIKTVCLDEAHHLKNEWQKSLEMFISQLDKDVKVIALTATPPYDSEGNEWERYYKICGEIDEEIFVPELVGQNTLCPHQDYVYFNFPTKAELEFIESYKLSAEKAISDVKALPFTVKLCEKVNNTTDYGVLFSNVREYVALLVLFSHYGFEVKKKLIRQLTVKKSLPKFSYEYAEIAIQFMIDGGIISEEEKEQLVDVLKENGVYHKKKVSLFMNEKLRRQLISSVGKLESIKAISKSEVKALGESLRMLVLCDYIKKESLAKISSNEEFSSVNIVSIFETIRRENPDVKIGVLSGTLVILPESVDLSDIKHKKEKIEGTDYCVVDIIGANHKAVDYVGKLFEKGELKILVGTKSLLGEGWDSPCINSLILASFVGSFVLSNQMRGRAIRIDKNNPEKSSGIWHLVTVEPEYIFTEKKLEQIVERIKYDEKQLVSCDYEILKRRFDAFMGPHYETGVIESGIERITAIKPPFDKQGIEDINKQMLSLASDRKSISDKWKGEVSDGKFNVCVESEIPKETRIPPFLFLNFGLVAIISFVSGIVLSSVYSPVIKNSKEIGLFELLVTLAVVIVFFNVLKKFIIHINPARSFKSIGKAVYKTLCQCELISESAKVETVSDKFNSCICIYLRNATIYDQNIFNTAIKEMFSPIENPRYIVIKKNIFDKYKYKLSFACPSIIGKKKEYVEVFVSNLKDSSGRFDAVYTHRENGREFILRCRQNSYITFNERQIDNKYKVSRYE